MLSGDFGIMLLIISDNNINVMVLATFFPKVPTKSDESRNVNKASPSTLLSTL